MLAHSVYYNIHDYLHYHIMLTSCSHSGHCYALCLAEITYPLGDTQWQMPNIGVVRFENVPHRATQECFIRHGGQVFEKKK